MNHWARMRPTGGICPAWKNKSELFSQADGVHWHCPSSVWFYWSLSPSLTATTRTISCSSLSAVVTPSSLTHNCHIRVIEDWLSGLLFGTSISKSSNLRTKHIICFSGSGTDACSASLQFRCSLAGRGWQQLHKSFPPTWHLFRISVTALPNISSCGWGNTTAAGQKLELHLW